MRWLDRVLVAIGARVPDEQTGIDTLTSGRVRLRGTIDAEPPLTSPIRKKSCVGYSYSSTYRVPTARGFSRRKLREANVWSDRPTLKLEGGAVTLLPPRSEPLTPEDHVRLRDHGFDDFKAKERLVKPGDTVVVIGAARREGDAWIVKVETLEVIGDEA